METLFLYLAKSSGLIALFFLSYYFMLRKETFFTSNRWFLLAGLFTSVLLPLFFIKRVVWIEQPKIALDNLTLYQPQNRIPIQEVSLAEVIDWERLLLVGYSIICCVFVIKIIVNLLSLYQLLYKRQIIKSDNFKLIDLNENIAPFSFFNYIVFNSQLYTKEELESILMHEKIHSKEKHSVDVLIAKVFCIVFWFNPFMWLYKKAIIQNLEYIADKKAIHQLEDRKTYQHALLKVISHQNSLSITNNFYQSLIKKRIVMLNKNQSNKSKSWKYVLILPLLVGFIFLFQIKTIAQELKTNSNSVIETHDGADITFDATETDKSLKTLKNVFKEEKITTTVSKVKRNAQGEITGIHIKMKSEDGRKKELKINQTNPIDKIFIYTNRMRNGLYDFGIKHVTKEEVASVANQMHIERAELHHELNNQDENEYSLHYDFEVPKFKELTEFPETDITEFPEFPDHVFNNVEKTVVIKKDNEKPIVIINGKVIEGDENLLDKKQMEELINSTIIKRNGKKQKIIINGKDIKKISSEAFKNSRREFEKIRPEIRARVNVELEKVKKELERTATELNDNLEKTAVEASREKSENAKMEEARQEMLQAKKEMLQAKAEMEAAKAELEQAKANLKTKK
jgi:Zn-dependent protease with chaperone function